MSPAAMGMLVVPTRRESITASTPWKKYPTATPAAIAVNIQSVRKRSATESLLPASPAIQTLPPPSAPRGMPTKTPFSAFCLRNSASRLLSCITASSGTFSRTETMMRRLNISSSLMR
jgi:hypothetical protein